MYKRSRLPASCSTGRTNHFGSLGAPFEERRESSRDGQMTAASTEQARKVVEDVYRAESRHVLATLIRLLGDFDLAEEAMQQAFALIQRVAPSDATVLISGESGAGKELAARAIHQLSPRADAPFVAINCAAMPESLIESELFGHERGAFTGALTRRPGCFEQAHRGTLFLDEIAEMPVGMQAKLLRVLQDGRIRRLGADSETPVDVRVLAATNRPPAEAVQEKLLREDLYYRLNVFQITITALRHRKEDLPLLADSLIRELNERHGCRVAGVDPAAMAALMCHPWPGNVRELRNVLERAVIIARDGMLEAGHLPPAFGAATVSLPAPEGQKTQEPSFTHRSGATLRELQDAYIRHTLSLAGNNKRRAARILDISERTLHSRVTE